MDINTDIYPMQEKSFYALVLASSLTADGAEDFDLFRHGQQAGQTGADASNLIDQFEYVMNGKIFNDKASEDQKKMLLKE